MKAPPARREPHHPPLPTLLRASLTAWLAALRPQRRPRHVFVAVVDHFEPGRGDAPAEVAGERLGRWLRDFPALADAYRDADGRPPRQTWCYPIDEWRDGELAALSDLVYRGYGEIELHLHHRHDTGPGFSATIATALERFGRHGALIAAGAVTRPRFAFVHGNWCLDNSRPDGDWCGVNDEIARLAAAGCYADFTFPAPNACQPAWANGIARVTDDPARPRSHDAAVPLRAGLRAPGDLVLIQGPLGVNLRDWHHGRRPAIEQGELTAVHPVSRGRVRFWLDCGIGVRGRPDWTFVKLHCHGCLERDQPMMLGELRHQMHRLLELECDGRRRILHYCTARELFNLAVAAEAGYEGEPAEAFDYEVARPVNALLRSDVEVDVAALSEASGDIRNLSAGNARWELRVGPIASLDGAIRRLRWQGAEVSLEGTANLVRRPETRA